MTARACMCRQSSCCRPGTCGFSLDRLGMLTLSPTEKSSRAPRPDLHSGMSLTQILLDSQPIAQYKLSSQA